MILNEERGIEEYKEAEKEGEKEMKRHREREIEIDRHMTRWSWQEVRETDRVIKSDIQRIRDRYRQIDNRVPRKGLLSSADDPQERKEGEWDRQIERDRMIIRKKGRLCENEMESSKERRRRGGGENQIDT